MSWRKTKKSAKKIKDDFAEDIIKEVDKNRIPKEKVSLKRTFIKKPTKKTTKKKN